MNLPIGLFDSGIGGLTVLKEIISLLPYESTYYLGDTARVPYGTKSAETVIGYALEDSKFLINKKIKLLVVACNTASAVSIPTLEKRFSIPIIGVIEPGAKKAAKTSKNKRVGVIGTTGTIKSGAYQKSIRAYNPEIKVFTRACPLFVPLVEEGWTNNLIAKLTAAKYLVNLKKEGVDSIVLGCTHYPLLKKTIKNVLCGNISLIDSGEETAAKVAFILKKLNIENRSEKKPERLYYVTDSIERFKTVGEKFLGTNIENVEKVAL